MFSVFNSYYSVNLKWSMSDASLRKYLKTRFIIEIKLCIVYLFQSNLLFLFYHSSKIHSIDYNFFFFYCKQYFHRRRNQLQFCVDLSDSGTGERVQSLSFGIQLLLPQIPLELRTNLLWNNSHDVHHPSKISHCC